MEQQVSQLIDVGVQFGLNVLGAVGVLILGRIIAGWARSAVQRALTKYDVDVTLRTFLTRMTFVLVIVFAVIAALARFGVQTTSFVAVLGAAGFAIGMALQGSLSNFAAGIMIILFRPYGVGDAIEAAGVTGTVKSIQLFTTEIATFDNVKVVIPNGQLFSGVIKNFSVYDTRRADITVGIAYDAPIDRAREIVLELLGNDERVFKDPEPQVFVNELADSSINLLVRFWTKRTDFWGAKMAVNEQIKSDFDIHGIEIPFPQRVVHVRQVAAGD